ncbi:MAG: hypothetical protein KF782_10395 [Labilithrix sp.]|nr:hypothetical protein [Labilithrix sp.]
MRLLLAASLLLALSASACHRKETAGENAAGSPAIVVAARAVESCKWSDADWRGYRSPVHDCPALKTWEESFGSKASQYESEIVDLMSDPVRGARWAAAKSLERAHHTRWRSDEELTRRVLARVYEEKEPAVAHAVGNLVGAIWLDDGKFAEPVLAALRPGVNVAVRAGVAEVALAANPKIPAVAAAVVEVARTSGPPSPRIAALTSLAYHSLDEPTCEVLLDASRDPDAMVAVKATSLLVGSSALKGCPTKWDALLTKLSETSALTKEHVVALDRIAEVATSELRTRAIAILRRIVETKSNHWSLRSDAFSSIRERDPKAKDFAAPFLSDEDIMIRGEAARILGVEVPLVLWTVEDAGVDGATPRDGDGGARGKP